MHSANAALQKSVQFLPAYKIRLSLLKCAERDTHTDICLVAKAKNLTNMLKARSQHLRPWPFTHSVLYFTLKGLRIAKMKIYIF